MLISINKKIVLKVKVCMELYNTIKQTVLFVNRYVTIDLYVF